MKSLSIQKEALKKVTNWLINIEIPLRRDNPEVKALSTKERVDYYQKIYDLNETGSLNSNRAKDLIEDILKSDAPITDIEKYASDKGYIQVSNESEITEIVRQVLADNEKATNDLKNGETKVIGFLIGQIMKQSQGKANPAIAQKIINQLIKL